MIGKKVIIMGAAGRDFHNFNVVFRDNPEYEVVAFTATQIPNIDGRKYPKELAGDLYPKGIPIHPEAKLEELIKSEQVQTVIFSYSDVSFNYVMERSSRAMAAGADFLLLGPTSTSLKSQKPVIAVCAIRTGAGKSQSSRRVCEILKSKRINFCVIRHPMPYGNLVKQSVQRFSKLEDLDRYNCTIEEREEYEPHIMRGTTVFAGVDYGLILKEAEHDFDLIVWDGGNNDFPFYRPDLLIVIADPLRAGQELTFYPGAALFRMANIIVINKIDSATKEMVDKIKTNAQKYASQAQIVLANSTIFLSNPALVKDKNVLVVEDGPTLTHGDMTFGAGIVAAQRFGAKTIVDPRPFAVGSIKKIYETYPNMGKILPALGYSKEQSEELEATINRTRCDAVIVATPVNLNKIIKINKPTVRVRYELEETSRPDLAEIIDRFLA
jgi:predicted GTPase